MIEHASVDLLDTTSRLVPFTDATDPLWSGVMVLAPGESVCLAPARHDLLVLNGTLAIADGRVLEGGDFAILDGSTGLRAGSTGAQVFAYRDTACTASDEIIVRRDERPWREGRTPGMLVATLPDAGHALSLVMWQPNARTRHHAHPGGEEIFVVRGELCEDARYPAGSWMRLHPGAWHSPHVETPTLILVRGGHLKGRPKLR
jgi:quercetin dioxygenase-like cupin family protein